MDKDLRSYTKRNLKKSLLASLLEKISVTNWIIIANVLAFIIVSIVLLFNKNFIDYIALRPSYVFHGQYLWTFITSVFMHAGLAHLFFNMFTLFFIGSFVEKIIGKRRYFWFYIIAGIFAGLFFAGLAFYFGSGFIGEKIFGNPDVAGLGASGAIFGLLGILAVLTPRAKVYLIVGPLIAIVGEAILQAAIGANPIFPVIDFLIQIYFLIALFSILSFNSKLSKIALPLQIPMWSIALIAIIPLIIINFFIELPIGNMAHFGGFIAGVIYGLYLRNKYSKKVEMLNRYIK